MISKSILLIFAVLVAYAVAQGANKTLEQQYKEFLAIGLDKKFVDQLRINDEIDFKKKAEAKGDPEKLKKVRKESNTRGLRLEGTLPRDQFIKYNDEKQYKELLAAGMKEDFVDMIATHDIKFDASVKAAKGNATLIKKLDDEYYIGVQALADSFPVKDSKILYAWFEKNPQKL
ncbi:unnamed protein product [Caenorhabditis brenneri]